MKFLCDRCKTRYSIGDDRVRGKILKIRCKNCANVITVREGMTDADAADAGPRRNKTTTAAPTVVAPPINANGAGGQGALGAAFATALTTKPPAALEEEWYVSIDGDQEGPFSLTDAQRWIANKAFDADLHCWSEGFDDWLPVDKVSHFRGLRKKPIAPPLPAAPPPMPRMAPSPAARLAAQPAPQARPIEDEPKPLFAATMASLERGAPQASNPGLSIPSLNGNGARPSATPPGGVRAIPAITKPANGAGAMKVPSAISPVPPASPISPVSAKGTKSEPARVPTNLGQAPPKGAFDVNDQATMIEAAPFEDDALKRDVDADAFVKSLGASAMQDVVAKPAIEAKSPVSNRAANAPVENHFGGDEEDDDGLAIGEVSRVVNLADLMQSAKPKRAEPVAARAALNRTNSVPRLGNTGAIARIDDPALAAGFGSAPISAEAPSEMTIAPAVQAHHRRGLFILIGVATLLLAGVIVAVVMLVGSDSDITTLGRSDSIDTTRPDDPQRRPGTPESPQTGSAQNPFFPQTPKYRPKVNPPQNPPPEVETPGSNRLGGEDVEAMARAQSSTTQRCYMRAQRGADAILIGDVKKINVTIEVAPDGSIKTVDLSAHATNTLGKCLIGAIRSWKFRASPGGTYKFALVFSAS